MVEIPQTALSAARQPHAPTAAAGAVNAPRPYLTIRAGGGWAALNLREIWAFRDLLWSLVSRDLKLRYKQTVLGVAWVILQPLVAAGVFSFVFVSVAKLPTGGVPPIVFMYAGLLGWNFFQNVLTKVSGCLVGNSGLISKVYFPRLILPGSNVGSSLVDFLISACVMGVLLAVCHIVPSPGIFLLPLWMLVLTAIAMGIGLWTAALSVAYRDIQYILPVALNILLYASPVAYSVAAVPPKLRWVYLLNPLTPPLDAMRSSLLGTAGPGAGALAISAGVAAVLLVAGLYAFKRMERSFADVI